MREAVPAHLHVTVDDVRAPGRRALLLAAAPHTANEALWTSRRSARVLRTDRWTLVVTDDEVLEAHQTAAALSAALGQNRPVLLLQQLHDELTLSVWLRGRERSSHGWGTGVVDAVLLADRLEVGLDEMETLLSHPGRPAEVLSAMSRVPGTPPQLVEVLIGAGADAISELEPHAARGLQESVLAVARGDFDPPDGRAPHHRLARWQRQRPPTYRAVNGLAAVGQAFGAAALASSTDGGVLSGSAALAGLLTVGAASSAWSARPPRGSR